MAPGLEIVPEASPFRQALKPLLNLIVFSGLAYPPKCKRGLRLVCNLYSSFVFIFTLSGLMLMFRFYNVGQLLSSHMASTTFITVFTWLELVGLGHLLWGHRCQKLDKLEQMLSNATKQQGIEQNLKSFGVRVWVTTIACVVISISLTVTWVYESFLEVDGFGSYTTSKLYFIDIPSVNAFLCIFIFSRSVGWFGYICLFYLTCSAVKYEFKFLNDHINIQPYLTVELLNSVAFQYGKLIEAVRFFSSNVKWFFCCAFSGAILMIIFISFYIFLDQKGMGDPMSDIMVRLWLATVVLLFSFVTTQAALIHEKAKKIKETISHKLLSSHGNESKNSELYQTAAWLREQTNNDIGISIGGLFIITKSVLLTGLSLVITYVLLLIQMKSSDTICDCVCVTNCTNCLVNSLK